MYVTFVFNDGMSEKQAAFHGKEQILFLCSDMNNCPHIIFTRNSKTIQNMLSFMKIINLYYVCVCAHMLHTCINAKRELRVDAQQITNRFSFWRQEWDTESG